MKVGDLVTIAWIPDGILPEVLAGLRLLAGAMPTRPWVMQRLPALVRDRGLAAVPGALTCDTVIVRKTKGGLLVTEAGPRFEPRNLRHAGPGRHDLRIVIAPRRGSVRIIIPRALTTVEKQRRLVLADLLEELGVDASVLTDQ